MTNAKPWLCEELAANGSLVRDNFLRWYGRDGVVDSAGDPLRVFHGTAVGIERFDPKRIGESNAMDDRGFFFVSDPAIASAYANPDAELGHERSGANVLPAYVALKKPLRVDAAFLKSEGMCQIGERDDVIGFWDTYQDLILEWADERRADGVVLVDSSKLGQEPVQMVVAFRAEQIKSACGNCGLYQVGSSSLTDHDAEARLLRARKASEVLSATVKHAHQVTP